MKIDSTNENFSSFVHCTLIQAFILSIEINLIILKHLFSLPFFAILESFSLFLIFQDLLEEADRLKKQGNSLFEKKRIDEALSCYLDAVSILPTRPQPPQEDEDGSNREQEEEEESSKVDVKGKGKAKEEEEVIAEEIKSEEFKKLEIKEGEDLEIQCRKARAVLYSNLAACYLNLVSRI